MILAPTFYTNFVKNCKFLSYEQTEKLPVNKGYGRIGPGRVISTWISIIGSKRNAFCYVGNIEFFFYSCQDNALFGSPIGLWKEALDCALAPFRSASLAIKELVLPSPMHFELKTLIQTSKNITVINLWDKKNFIWKAGSCAFLVHSCRKLVGNLDSFEVDADQYYVEKPRKKMLPPLFENISTDNKLYKSLISRKRISHNHEFPI